jgi:eukaryotic-like serine/threonine-protein kinase
MPDTPDLSKSALGSATETDLSGRQLGDFHLLRRLGRGAMADVYLAEQCRLKRRVAIKILRPELAGDRTYLQRFEIEAQAAASLVHANIVQIYEVDCVDQLHYIAQEYVQGQNLREHLARHGPPDLPHALSIMRQVAAALAKAAERGVVHRDIKPENIMLTAGGEVKVADFGLARLTREGAANNLTQVGITLGTPLYMSPEQVEGKPLDPRSDLYSFGVTCYHMLSGSPPFGGETALGVAVQHLKARPQPLESLRGDLPPALCRIVHHLLAKSPTERLGSARELLRELRRVQVEYCGGDWPEDLPAWESIATDMATDACADVTQRLGGLMNTLAVVRPRRWGWLWIAVGVVGAAVVGGASAWELTAPAPLLADAKSAEPAIGTQRTIAAQYYLAARLGTKAAWQSVINYKTNGPEDESVVIHAEQQLALTLLRNLEFDQAYDLFDKLASLDNDEVRAFGLAGKCGILSIRGRYAASDQVFTDLLPILKNLRSPEMRRVMLEFVNHAFEQNRARLSLPPNVQWEQIFSTETRDAG